ncbi:MAG: HU family DNA-binding protein [Bacteroidales bacterium]
MPIFYIKKKITVNVKGVKQDRYKAAMYRNGMISQKKVATRINKGSTVAEAEVKGILSDLQAVLEDLLLEGFTVQMDFGTFRPTVQARAVKDPKDVTADTIKNKKFSFTPSTRLKEKMKGVTLRYLDLNKVPHV